MTSTANERQPLIANRAKTHKNRHTLAGISGGLVMVALVAMAFSSTSGVGVQATSLATTNLQANSNTVQETLLAEKASDAAPSSVGADATNFSSGQYDFIYNILSFAIAAMGSATIFFFFQFTLVHKNYRTALIITGLVTLIAFYHYMRIFNSFTAAYVSNSGTVTPTGIPFNDAYRYVDWLLTVPLLLIELILVMDLSPAETREKCIKLGVSAAVMVILGYPGEISDSHGTRWVFWALAMVPFIFIVYTLFVGLSYAVDSQPSESRGLVNAGRWVTVVSWCTYPIIYIFPMLGLSGAAAKTAIQVGYSIADVIAKPLLGLLVWQIASRKSASADLRSLNQ